MPEILYLTAYGSERRPTTLRFSMPGKINYEAVFPYVVRKRQQMPSPSHFKVDLSHHSNFHANKKVKNVFHIVSHKIE